jgi:hypothetical protein
MKTIGISTDGSLLVYEGNGTTGYPVWPTPTLIPLAIVSEASDSLVPDKDQSDACRVNYVFLDEGYDPTSRVRKGRIFRPYSNMQPEGWHVSPHPFDKQEQDAAMSSFSGSGRVRKSLATFSAFSLTAELKNNSINDPLFLLGNETDYTIWSLVDQEATLTGETLVYLKARKVFGALPELTPDILESEDTALAREKLDILAEDLHRAGPDSVIDRAREAATAIISAYLQSKGHESAKRKDLGKLANLVSGPPEEKNVVANLANTIAILHGRGKTAERQNRDTRPSSEPDAELAVEAVGLILRDLGWAKT